MATFSVYADGARMSNGTQSDLDDELDDIPPPLYHNQKCDIHKDELVVGYRKDTKAYLCRLCISKDLI